MTVTEELFNGNVRPAESHYISEKYSDAQTAQGQCSKLIEKLLPEKERETLEKFLDNTSEMEYEFGLKMFRTGLSIGIRLSAECYYKNETTGI